MDEIDAATGVAGLRDSDLTNYLEYPISRVPDHPWDMLK